LNTSYWSFDCSQLQGYQLTGYSLQVIEHWISQLQVFNCSIAPLQRLNWLFNWSIVSSCQICFDWLKFLPVSFLWELWVNLCFNLLHHTSCVSLWTLVDRVSSTFWGETGFFFSSFFFFAPLFFYLWGPLGKGEEGGQFPYIACKQQRTPSLSLEWRVNHSFKKKERRPQWKMDDKWS